jgi:hypothetical protein
MAVRLPALRAARALSLRNIPGTHFYYSLNKPQGHTAAQRIRYIEESISLGMEPGTFGFVA